MLATWFITRQLEYFGGTMGNLTLKGKVTLGMVRNSIFNKEIQKMDLMGNDTHALIMENRGRSRSKGRYGQTNQEVDHSLKRS